MQPRTMLGMDARAEPRASYAEPSRLLDALHCSGDEAGENQVLRRLDLAGSVGASAYLMALAQNVMRAGGAERAHPVAYDLVRRFGNDPQVAVGYLGLVSPIKRPIRCSG